MPPTRIPPEDVAYPAHMQAISFPTAAAQAAKTVCDRIAALLNEHLLARPGLVDGAATAGRAASAPSSTRPGGCRRCASAP